MDVTAGVNRTRLVLAEMLVERVGRDAVCDRLGVTEEGLDGLLSGGKEFSDDLVGLLVGLSDADTRKSAGESGVGGGETPYEVWKSGQRELAGQVADYERARAPRVEVQEGAVDFGDLVVVGADGVAEAGEEEEVDECSVAVVPVPAAPSAPAAPAVVAPVDAPVDEEMLVRARRVADLHALLRAGHDRLWSGGLSDRDWRELWETICGLELVLILDFGVSPDDVGDVWDDLRCRREAEVRWLRLGDLRRSLDEGWAMGLWRGLTGIFSGRRPWLEVLMADVDLGSRGGPAGQGGQAASWLGVSKELETRWRKQGIGSRRG